MLNIPLLAPSKIHVIMVYMRYNPMASFDLRCENGLLSNRDLNLWTTTKHAVSISLSLVKTKNIIIDKHSLFFQ